MSGGTRTTLNMRPLAPAAVSNTLKSGSGFLAQSLNPSAPVFLPHLPDRSVSLRPVAESFFPNYSPDDNITKEITDQINMMSLDTVGSGDNDAETQDLTDLREGVMDGVQFVPGDHVFVLTCDTKSMLTPSTVKETIAALVEANGLPHRVQLNVLTGPRLQAVHMTTKWFKDIMEPYLHTVQHAQVAIVRSGEAIEGKWLIMGPELETFEPLRKFVEELLQVLPQRARILWGSSVSHGLQLQTLFHSKATLAVLSAIKDHGDKGVRAYSEALDGRILAKIAAHIRITHGKGKKLTYNSSNVATLSDRSTNSSRASNLNPHAQSFRLESDPMFAQFQQYMLPNPEEPFFDQLLEVDEHHLGTNSFAASHLSQWQTAAPVQQHVSYHHMPPMEQGRFPLSMIGDPENMHIPVQTLVPDKFIKGILPSYYAPAPRDGGQVSNHLMRQGYVQDQGKKFKKNNYYGGKNFPKQNNKYNQGPHMGMDFPQNGTGNGNFNAVHQYNVQGSPMRYDNFFPAQNGYEPSLYHNSVDENGNSCFDVGSNTGFIPQEFSEYNTKFNSGLSHSIPSKPLGQFNQGGPAQFNGNGKKKHRSKKNKKQNRDLAQTIQALAHAHNPYEGMFGEGPVDADAGPSHGNFEDTDHHGGLDSSSW